MQRRLFLLQALTALPMVAMAKDIEINKDSVPLKHIYIPSDASKVVCFFDFSCNFSASYQPALFNWSRTAPSQVKTEFIPIINLSDSRRVKEMSASAAAFLAAQTLAKNSDQLESFVVEVYNARHIKGMPLNMPQIWELAAKKSKIPHDKLFALAKSIPAAQLQSIAKKCQKYQLTVTPTVGVAGQYLLTPDNANGDPELFFNLLNGLVSNFILS